jgi:hypothetical protein
VLDAMGRESDANAVMEEALHLPGTDAVSVYIYTMRLVRAGKMIKLSKLRFSISNSIQKKDFGPT